MSTIETKTSGRQREYIDRIRLDIGLVRGRDGYGFQGEQALGRMALGKIAQPEAIPPDDVPGEGGRLLFFIDERRVDHEAGLLVIQGWAAVDGPLPAAQKIDLFLTFEGGELELDVYQRPRPDVVESLPQISHKYCGFYATLDLSELTEADYALIIGIRDADCRRVSFPGELLVGELELQKKIKLMRECEMEQDQPRWFEIAQSFFLHEQVTALDPDPYSAEYRMQQLQLYYRLTDRDKYVSRQAEVIDHKVSGFLDPRPFPCCTGYLEHIGNHLLQAGHIFRELDLSEGDSVLEYGAGCGFLTMLLAASGLDVSAVDINPDCVEIIETNARGRGLQIATLAGEFGEVPPGKGPFDAILFFESFHHCLEFDSVLAGFHDLLKDGGRLVFACEPISEGFPKPWGVRLDGQSVFEIITKGWLELGFREDFFNGLLARHGWKAEKREFADISPIFIASRA